MYKRLKAFLSLREETAKGLVGGDSPLAIPEVLLGIIFALDTDYKLVQLDQVEIGSNIWNEVAPSKPIYMNPRDVGMQIDASKGCGDTMDEKIDCG
jgi:hypothetical protein